jgi:hypothetical protein
MALTCWYCLEEKDLVDCICGIRQQASLGRTLSRYIATLQYIEGIDRFWQTQRSPEMNLDFTQSQQQHSTYYRQQVETR